MTLVPVHQIRAHSVFHIKTEAEALEFTDRVLGLPTNPKFNRAGAAAAALSQLLPITTLVEADYIDKDWSSLLSLHYSVAYGQYPRFVSRVHVFRGVIPDDGAIFAASEDADAYKGFFTVYPSRPRSIGRTLLAAKAFGRVPGTMICRSQIHVAGHRYLIDAFPFSGQDFKVVCCAHVAMWDIIRYYSTKYGYYGEHYHGDFARLCDDRRIGRGIPTRGLYYAQILAGFSQLRIRPTVYSRDPANGVTSVELADRARGYIRSGIPVIVAGDRHAVAAIGLKDVSDPRSELIVNDDNYFPYGIMGKNTANQCRFAMDKIEFVFVPLYEKIIVPYETAIQMTDQIAQNVKWGHSSSSIQKVGKLEKRVFLASSKSYKESLTERDAIGLYEVCVMTYPLPKFVWIAEWFESSTPGKLMAEYVFDATTSEHDETSFLFLKYPEGFRQNDRFNDAVSDDNISWTPAPVAANWTAFPGNLRDIT